MLLKGTVVALSFLPIVASSSVDNIVEQHGRLLQNGLLLAAEAMEVMDEFSCTMKGATTESECKYQDEMDMGSCVWCPMGDLGGICMSEEQGSQVNEAKIPHFQCGVAVEELDVMFWNDVVGCIMAGSTGSDCVGSPTETGHGCSWCTIDLTSMGVINTMDMIDEDEGEAMVSMKKGNMMEGMMMATPKNANENDPFGMAGMTGMMFGMDSNPGPGMMGGMDFEMNMTNLPPFGLCYSTDMIKEGVDLSFYLMKMLNVTDDDLEEVESELSKYFTCSQKLGDAPPVDGLYDMSCVIVTAIGDESFCLQSVDSNGKGCRWSDVMGLANACLSETQDRVIQFYTKLMDDMGLSDTFSMLAAMDDTDDTNMMGDDMMGGDMMLSGMGSGMYGGENQDIQMMEGFGSVSAPEVAGTTEEEGCNCGEEEDQEEEEQVELYYNPEEYYTQQEFPTEEENTEYDQHQENTLSLGNVQSVLGGSGIEEEEIEEQVYDVVEGPEETEGEDDIIYEEGEENLELAEEVQYEEVEEEEEEDSD